MYQENSEKQINYLKRKYQKNLEIQRGHFKWRNQKNPEIQRVIKKRVTLLIKRKKI